MVEIAGWLPEGWNLIEVSVLYREPMWLKFHILLLPPVHPNVSVLYREPMWLKFETHSGRNQFVHVSVLYREPMWLKFSSHLPLPERAEGFSALP